MKIIMYIILFIVSMSVVFSFPIILIIFNIDAPFLIFNIFLGIYLLMIGADYIDRYFEKQKLDPNI